MERQYSASTRSFESPKNGRTRTIMLTAAHQHRLAVNRDHCVVRGVLRMEVGRLVVVEVHRDHDAVEGSRGDIELPVR